MREVLLKLTPIFSVLVHAPGDPTLKFIYKQRCNQSSAPKNALWKSTGKIVKFSQKRSEYQPFS